MSASVHQKHPPEYTNVSANDEKCINKIRFKNVNIWTISFFINIYI